MSDLEQLLAELVTSASEDATDGFEGLSLATRRTMSDVREVFTNLVRDRINPLLNRVVEAAQRDAQGDAERQPIGECFLAVNAVMRTYDEMFEQADEA